MKSDSPAYRAALSKQDYHKLTGFDGDWRDTWWNDAFLSMMAELWGLDRVGNLLDVGCGVGCGVGFGVGTATHAVQPGC